MLSPHLTAHKKQRQKSASLPLASCVAVIRPRPFANALSAWSGELRPPLTIPRPKAFRPWTLNRACRPCTLPGGDFVLPPSPIEQGVPPMHPDQPCRLDTPPRGYRSEATGKSSHEQEHQ